MKIQLGVVGITVLLCLIIHSWKVSCILLFLCIILLLLISFSQKKWQERSISKLIMYLMKVQNQLELPEMEKYNEGQLGILQSEIYKLVILLQEQSQSVTKKNIYLAEMLSDISHQIKTPLTSIMIMTELLDNPDLEEEKRVEFVGKINQQVNKITWLIRNLLTLSQLEADVLKLKRESIEVKEILEKVCQSAELMAEVKEIALIIQADEGIKINCDLQWTTEAILNIVKNCIEHTSCGGYVKIGVTQNNFATNIRIVDNGEGIAKEHLPHIFERFYKGGDTSPNSIGIGLAMAKQIIIQQNGIIEAESEKGKGTEFFIRFYSEMII